MKKLSLKRDVLGDLTAAELRLLAAGRPTELCYSAYDFVSCRVEQCLLSERYTICLEA